MLQTKLIAKLIIAMALSCGAAHGQELNNPNELPPCPKPDYSKKTDVERFAKWTECWGRYRVELDKDHKGEVLEGEWLNGWLNGQGTYTYASGDKYLGAFKDGKKHGQGTYTFASGSKYVGEFKDDKQHGQGTRIAANGDKYVGEYEDGKAIGQHTFAGTTDRPDIDRERRKLEEEERQEGQKKAKEIVQMLLENMDGPPVKSEAKAKIKLNKQYICSDGHDSYVLKYNGSVVVFGNIRLQYTFGNFYRDSLDKGRLRIDRETGKAVFDGTPMQCRPR